MTIIVIDWWLHEEPQISFFDSREEAEVDIREGRGYGFGNPQNLEIFDGVELEIGVDGSLHERGSRPPGGWGKGVNHGKRISGRHWPISGLGGTNGRNRAGPMD